MYPCAARKKNLELMSKVASKGPPMHPAPTAAHLPTEKALQEVDSLFSDARKLLLNTILAEGHFFFHRRGTGCLRWRANGKCHAQ